MKKIFPFFLLVLLLASCQKDPDMSKLDDDFVVFTDYSNKTDFKSFTTFYIPDSVMEIGNSQNATFWNSTEADQVISTLEASLKACGYVQVADKDSADLGIQASYITSINYFSNYYDNPYWWNDYPGYNWWYGYWGNNWNGWYYPYPVVYSYSVGSLLVEMVNLKATSDSKLPVIWTAYMAGLLSGSNDFNMQLATQAIKQAFTQSPYIKAN